ncbi:MAG: outer membrane beta-barrel protein [Verrucomicrobiota bacterium]
MTAALLAIPGVAFAIEPQDVLVFSKGPLTLRPELGLAEMYNDNIFYRDKDTLQDFISVISPGLRLDLGKPQHNYLSLGYTMDQLFYADHSELETAQHSIDLRSRFELQRIRLEGSDRVQFLSSPLGGVVERVVDTNGVVTVVSRNIDRTSWDDNYTLTYDLGEKTAVYLRGYHSTVDYQQRIGLYDIETFSGTGGFSYRAFPKTALFGEIYYGQTSTEPNHPALPRNPSLNFIGGYIGARGNFTEKLSGMAKIGYESREFGDGTEAPSDPVVDLSLTQRFSEKQSLSLSYSRLNTASIQYNRQTYTADVIGLQFVQILGSTGKWRATVGGSYTLYQYEASGQTSISTQYDYVRASASLGYQIQRWLMSSIGYEYERVAGDSRAVIDYTVNRVSLRLAIGY